MYASPPHPPSTILNLELLLSKYTIHLVTIKNWVLLPLMSYNRYKKIINMYTLSYSHSLHANTGSEGSARRAGGLVTPNPSAICTGHPECPGRGPAPGASPALGRVMGGTDQLPQCRCAGRAGSPVGGAGVSLGRGRANSHRDPRLCPPAGRWQGPGELCRGRSLAPARLTQI